MPKHDAADHHARKAAREAAHRNHIERLEHSGHPVEAGFVAFMGMDNADVDPEVIRTLQLAFFAAADWIIHRSKCCMLKEGAPPNPDTVQYIQSAMTEIDADGAEPEDKVTN